MKKLNYFIAVLCLFSCSNNKTVSEESIEEPVGIIQLIEETPQSPESIKALEDWNRERDSLNRIDRIKRQSTEIESAIKYLSETVPKKYYGDIATVVSMASEFKYYARLFNKYVKSDIPDIAAAAAKLEKTLKKTQKSLFPVFRKNYVDFAKKKLWEEDIDVKGNGKVITFTGSVFASNKYIKAFNDEVSSTIEILRFTKVNYKWYRDAQEYTSYTLFRNTDETLIE